MVVSFGLRVNRLLLGYNRKWSKLGEGGGSSLLSYMKLASYHQSATYRPWVCTCRTSYKKTTVLSTSLIPGTCMNLHGSGTPWGLKVNFPLLERISSFIDPTGGPRWRYGIFVLVHILLVSNMPSFKLTPSSGRSSMKLNQGANEVNLDVSSVQYYHSYCLWIVVWNMRHSAH